MKMGLTFEKIYQFEIFDKIKAGETVYMLDRANQKVETVNDLPFGDVALILSEKDEAKRYDFWIERKGTENE